MITLALMSQRISMVALSPTLTAKSSSRFSLSRYHFDKVQQRAQLNSRLVTILFPELEKLVPTLHMTSVYALLSELPSAMRKCSSRYLRYALINVAKYISHWNESFNAYLQKKLAEDKHYDVAITHVTKNRFG